MLDQTTMSTQQPNPSARGKDRWVKRIFLLATVAAVVAVYLLQRSGPGMPDWPGDLPAVLVRAKAESRPVLVFFHSSPPSATAQRLATTTILKNAAAIRKGRFLTARVAVSGLGSDLARQYRLTELPTLILLDPSGKETNRRTGFVGEVPFRNGFLDNKDVQAPPAR